MPRAKYSEEQKAAITKAAVDARKAGKPWKKAYEEAQSAGYLGSMQGIVKLLRSLEKSSAKGARRPGRPAGKGNKTRKVAPSTAAHTGDIASLVDSIVRSRVNDAIDRAIAALNSSKQ